MYRPRPFSRPRLRARLAARLKSTFALLMLAPPLALMAFLTGLRPTRLGR